jgi:hypothetical protein
MAISFADIRAFVNANPDPATIYSAAKQYGVSPAEIDTAMGWQPGTSQQWVTQQGLPTPGDAYSQYRVTPLTQEQLTVTPTFAAPSSAGSAAQINPADVREITPQTMKDYNLTDYMNPFLSQVRDVTISDMERARQLQQIKDEDAALGAKAFGGSRQGVQDANTNEAFQRTLAQALATLNAQGYSEGTGLIQADINRNMAGQTANQGRDLTIQGTNVGARNQMSMYNAGLANTIAALNAQLGTNASTATTNNMVNSQGQQISQNNAFLNADITQRGQDMSWLLGTANLTNDAALKAAQIGSMANIADWYAVNNANNATSGGGSTTTTTGQPPNFWNQAIGSLVLGNTLATPSDRRLKRNIKRIGTHPSGLPWYEFDYVWGEHSQGVMADEVIHVKPHAVIDHPSGFLHVNYGAL